MRNNSSNVCQFLRCAILVIYMSSLGCRSPEVPRSINQNSAVVLAVLEHMVYNADADTKIIRFVDLPTSDLEILRTTCGKKFLIDPVSMSESRGNSLYLTNSQIEGIELRVSISHMGFEQAEASGAFVSGEAVVAVQYKLRRERNKWRIIGTEAGGAS